MQITRRENPHQPLGTVTVESPDGTRQADAHLRRLLHDVDETIYQNVFAVGLHELQELGTLTDSQAARWLYVLTAGLDRVSLCNVLTELETSVAEPAPTNPRTSANYSPNEKTSRTISLNSPPPLIN